MSSSAPGVRRRRRRAAARPELRTMIMIGAIFAIVIVVMVATFAR